MTLLHTTRFLDTSLKHFLFTRGIPIGGRRSLGGYLLVLANHHTSGTDRLAARSCDRYRKSIVAPRNRFMHEADRYPSVYEANKVLNEMHACFADVIRLT